MSRNRVRARVWQTTTFRIAVALAAAFGLGTAILLLALDWAVGRFAEDTVRDALRDQVDVLLADANAEGGAALATALKTNDPNGEPQRFRYLVIIPDGRRLDGGLPRSVERIEGWGRIQIPTRVERPGSQPFQLGVIVLTRRAQDGTFIAVGRDTAMLEELREWLHRLAVWGGAGLVAMAVVAGAVGGTLFLRRLQKVKEAADRVVGGDLGERLPSLGFGREFDDLADTLNAMLDRLETTVGALRQVSSDVAHDLRTPLTRLRNTLGDARLAPGRVELLDEALDETDRLLEVFGALLRLAQIEGGAPGRLEPVDLAAIVRTVSDAYRPSVEEDGRALVLALDDGVTVLGDPAMLNQLAANLIDNAITHGAGGTRISIEARRDAQSSRLIVSDDGPGAPADELARLTRRFYRLDRSRNTPGAGLGLSMAAAIADFHRAVLRIEGRDPGFAVIVEFPNLADRGPVETGMR